MMADLLRIKSNVAKMVSMGAPEGDIDQYISEEGVTVNDVRNFQSPYLKNGADVRAKKMIPQFTKGLYENVPFGKRVVSMLPHGKQTAELMENTPEPQGVLPNLSRIAGKSAPDLAMMGPFVEGAGFIPKLPALMKLATGVGAYEGTKKAVEGKPGEVLPAALTAAGTTAALGYAGKGVAKLAPKVITALKNAPAVVKNIVTNIKNVKNPVQFSQNVRQVLFQQKKSVGDAFEAGIQQLSEANPGKSVDLSDAFKYIKIAIDDAANNPGLAAEIKGALRRIRNPELAKAVQDLIDDPVKAKSLTLAQSQEIKGIIQQATSIANKAGKGGFAQYKPGDLELLDLVDEIKLAQSEAFPEMAKVREPYAKYMGAYRNVKNKFKPGSLLDKMRNGFGDEEVQEMVKVVLPKDTVNQINGFRTTNKVIKGGAKVAGAGLAVEGARRFIKSIAGN